MSEMMEEILGLDARKLLPGSLILIEDSVAAKGAFLLNYFLKKLLAAPHASVDEAGGGTTRVLFLALSEPFSHYNRISRKQGCNLISYRNSGQLIFLDMVSDNSPGSIWTKGLKQSALFGLYERVNECVKRRGMQKSGEERTVIIIDDASLLEVLAGGVQNEVLAFLHYCRALYSGSHRCGVVALVHADTDSNRSLSLPVDGAQSPAAALVQELEHSADVIVTVDPLSTGLATDVHGQVSVVHWTDALCGAEFRRAPCTLQFKLLESSVLFSHPGGKF
ncbi:unnamed protein product [Sphagnum troendelagicum]|uniref:Elongator complex protein 6 n=1 Tax=Sphagnum troendelagicum TaxID=128251 RepID=A0ABP0TGM0_9BRYO